MEKNIQNIELINSYLNKKLTESESKDLENRLKNEPDFKNLFEEHIIFLEGIKRQTLKNEIRKGKQSYLRNKWFRYLGIVSSGLVVLFAVVYFNLFSSDKEYLKDKLNFESEFIQSFHVPIDSIIEIVGAKGTVIKFNPNHLETSFGKPYEGDSLKVELIELTTKQDLLFANAQTASNGKWLISGGAFKIDIKVKNEALVLKQGKTIDVRFPKTTSEDGMQIFYGDKNKDTNMNWDLSNIKLKDKKYYTLFLRDSSVIDEKLTKLYQVDLFKNIVLTDTLRLLNYNNIVEEFPEIEEIKPENDTLRIYDVTFRYPFYYSDNDDLFGEAEVLKRKYISISKSEIENVIKNRDVDYVINEKAFGLYNKVTNDFYESVKLSKLGWINIDKFAREVETVKIKLEFNLNTNHDEIYIVDQNNNTVLNVYNDEVNLPINRSFQIIAIGINGKDLFGFKKSFRFKKNTICKVEYKKINEKQIKSFLTLQNSIEKTTTKAIETSIKIDEPIILEDSISIKKEDIKGEILKPVKTVDTSFKKRPQKYKLNTQKDTVIVCKEGTKLTVKANSFVDGNGNSINGDIELKISEYYKLSDMLLANLSTSSNGKQLETGGMLFIEAKKGELDLKLKENSSIEISFPTKNKKEDMQLFSGLWENDNINWQLESTQEEQIEIVEVEVEEDIDVPFSVIEDVPIYPGCENLDKKSTRNCTSKSIQEFVQRNFNTEIAEAIGLTGRQRVNVIFKINKYGDVVSIRTRASYPILNEEAERVIALLPKMIPGKQRGKSVTVPYSLPIIFQLDGVSNSISVGSSSPSSKVLGDSVVAKKLEAILVDEKSPRLSAAVVSSYILTTAKLGWINCDRFIKSRSSLKYKLINKSTDGSVKVNMVFKSIKSVLPSTNLNGIFDFGTVPKDAKVTLIAIKKGNGKLYLSIIDTKTEENPDIEFKFKEVSLEELKSELIKLNNRIKF